MKVVVRTASSVRGRIRRFGPAGLIASACLLAVLIAGGARAAAPIYTVSNYTGTGISDPVRIAVGSDGALWFTNRTNNSIGRITTSGIVTNYTDPSISSPVGIAAGPDGALWFTNSDGTSTGSSIGRITTAGAVSNYPLLATGCPYDIAAGPDGALWYRRPDRLDRSDHHQRQTSLNTPIPASTLRKGARPESRPGLTEPSGSPTSPTTRSAGSRLAASSATLWFNNYYTDSIGRIQAVDPDGDGDGVSDAADQCPGTPSGQPVDARGCSASQYALQGGGAFVVGDQSATGTVTFWGAQWSKKNSLGGGAAPSAFKASRRSPPCRAAARTGAPTRVTARRPRPGRCPRTWP